MRRERMKGRTRLAAAAALLATTVTVSTGLRCPDFEAEVVEYELSEVRIGGTATETSVYGNRLEVAGDPEDLPHLVVRDGIDFVYYGAASTAEVDP